MEAILPLGKSSPSESASTPPSQPLQVPILTQLALLTLITTRAQILTRTCWLEVIKIDTSAKLRLCKGSLNGLHITLSSFLAEKWNECSLYSFCVVSHDIFLFFSHSSYPIWLHHDVCSSLPLGSAVCTAEQHRRNSNWCRQIFGGQPQTRCKEGAIHW